MLKRLWQALGSAVFWSYRRGSWQYDLIVAGILAFIFIAPQFINFGDQPRPPAIQEIESLSDEAGTLLFWVDPSVIDETPAEEVPNRLRALLRQRTGRSLQVIETKPTTDAEGEIRAYLVYARP
jgi:hypothetical protein